MEKEYFEKLEANQKKQSGLLTVVAICSVVICLCMGVITYSVISVMPKIGGILDTAQEAATSANTVIGDVEKLLPELEATAKGLSEISDSIQNEGLTKLYESLDNLNKIDINTLNESIQSLHDVVQPMARLFGR